jgi:TRAP-type C4-dicarboxylate transport system permease large subunit
MLLGFFTPTEAASVTVVYVILISAFVYRTLTLSHLLYAGYETLKSTAAILIIVSAAAIFGWILAIEQIPQIFAQQLLSLSTDPLILLLIVNVILLIVGMVLDSTTATLLVIPIIAGPLHMAGVDPVHLGIVAIFNLMLGLLTPPMGLALRNVQLALHVASTRFGHHEDDGSECVAANDQNLKLTLVKM